MWERDGGFASLLFIIIEQQVSLESARSTYEKLEAKLGTITPKSFLSLDDSEQRRLTMSRQKTRYGCILAKAVLDGELDFDVLPKLSDQEVYVVAGIAQARYLAKRRCCTYSSLPRFMGD